MNIIDVIIGAILLYGLVKGAFKGLFVEVASLIALIAGIYGSIHFSFYAKDLLVKYVSWEPKYVSLIAFAITFVIIVISISLVGKLLTKIASLAALGMINKILGGVFGALKIGLIISVLLGWFEKINGVLPFVDKQKTESSILYRPVKNLAPSFFPTLLNQIDTFSNTEKDDAKNA